MQQFVHQKKLEDDIANISDAEATIGFNKIVVHKDVGKLKSKVLDASNMTTAEKLER